jgi:hypothetical protein
MQRQGSYQGATTLSIITLSIMTLSIMPLSIMTRSITTLYITTLSIMTLSMMTLCMMTLSIMTLSIMTFSITTLNILINKKQHSGQCQCYYAERQLCCVSYISPLCCVSLWRVSLWRVSWRPSHNIASSTNSTTFEIVNFKINFSKSL